MKKEVSEVQSTQSSAKGTMHPALHNSERPANRVFNRINNFKYKIPVRKIYRIDDAPVINNHMNSGLKTETSRVSEKEINSISVKVSSPMNKTL